MPRTSVRGISCFTIIFGVVAALIGCAAPKSDASFEMAAGTSMTTDQINSRFNSLTAAQKTAIIRQVGAMSPLSYYDFITKGATSDSFTLDGRTVTDLKDKRDNLKTTMMSLQAQYPSMQNLWNQVGVDLNKVSNAASSGLNLDAYIYNGGAHNDAATQKDCQDASAKMEKNWGASGKALAAGLTALPTSRGEGPAKQVQVSEPNSWSFKPGVTLSGYQDAAVIYFGMFGVLGEGSTADQYNFNLFKKKCMTTVSADYVTNPDGHVQLATPSKIQSSVESD